MYILTWITQDGMTPHYHWGSAPTKQEAEQIYQRLLAKTTTKCASICAVVESTDFRANSPN